MWRVGYIFNHSEIIGGGELSFIDLIDSIRKFGIQPVAFVPGPGEVAERLKTLGINIQETDWPPIRIWSPVRIFKKFSRLAELFKNLDLNFIHTNGARCMLYAGPAARKVNIPCIWHVRVLERDRILDCIRSWYATSIVANSKAVSAKLSRIIGSSKHIEVVYNGFNWSKHCKIQPLDLQSNFGLPNIPVIVAVGRFTTWKKFEDLIQACNILKSEKLKFSCLIVGDALPFEKNYEMKLKGLVKELKLSNICFTGWREDVLAIMKSASLLTLTSHDEPFGRVIVEAWSVGLPVIATNTGGPSEIVNHGSDGILYHVGDIDELSNAIFSVISDSVLAEKLANKGKQRTEEFSLNKHTKQIVNVYKKIIL